MKKSGFMKIDIYVYDQGIPDIPQGHTGETIETELGNAGAAIQIHKEQGLYRDVEKLNAGVYPATGAGESIMFQWSRFQYRQTARPGVAFTGLRVSETFIRGFARHFIKIRFTYPAEASEVALPVRTKAIMQIGELMKAN